MEQKIILTRSRKKIKETELKTVQNDINNIIKRLKKEIGKFEININEKLNEVYECKYKNQKETDDTIGYYQDMMGENFTWISLRIKKSLQIINKLEKHTNELKIINGNEMQELTGYSEKIHSEWLEYMMDAVINIVQYSEPTTLDTTNIVKSMNKLDKIINKDLNNIEEKINNKNN